MLVLIPLAGLGKRLRPLSYSIPKPILRVAGKPVVVHILERIKNLPNVEGIHFVVSPNMEEIADYLRGETNIPISYTVQKAPLGLGHALFVSMESIKNYESILIILGDTIIEAKIENYVLDKVDFIGVREVENPRRFGVVSVDSSGRIWDLEEKPEQPKSNLIIAGLYFITDVKLLCEGLQHIIKNNITTKNEYQLTDALKYMLKKGWSPIPLEIDLWLDCGTVEEILKTNSFLLERCPYYESSTGENVKIIEPVLIKKGAKIENSTIGPYVYIEEDVEIKNSVVKDSIIYKGTKIINSEINKAFIGESCFVEGKFQWILIGNQSEVRC